MNRLALATGGLMLLTLGAFAQDQPPPPPAPDAPSTDMAAPPPPPGAEPGQADDDMAPPPPPRGKGPREERGPRRGRDGDRGPPPPPPSKAAHFRLEKGDMKIDVKCADDEPAKACAEITLQLIDRIAPKP